LAVLANGAGADPAQLADVGVRLIRVLRDCLLEVIRGSYK
jgi:hypothetical protein